MSKRITQALLTLALLPLLISAGHPASAQEGAPRVQMCHYEAEIDGTYTLRDGSTLEAPLGHITVATCSSPEDLARRVRELTNAVRAQATAQARQTGGAP